MRPRTTHHSLTGHNSVMRTSGRANVHSSISGSNTWSSGTIDWAEVVMLVVMRQPAEMDEREATHGRGPFSFALVHSRRVL